jgi:hypothetical protein
MPEQLMKALNNDERVNRINDFEVSLEKTVIDNQVRHCLSMSEPIVIDRHLAGKINKLAVQYLERYPDKESFVTHMNDLISDNLLECYALFKDEYNENENDIEGEFIECFEQIDVAEDHKVQYQ